MDGGAAAARGSSVAEAVATFVASVLGVGVLGMPYVFAAAGYAQAAALTLAVALAAAASMQLLLRSAHACGRATYEGVAEAALGPAGRRSVELTVLLLQFGMLVACLNTAADALGGVATSVVPAGAEPGREAVLLSVGVLVVLPMCVVLRTTERAAKASAVAVGVVAALAFAVAAVAADVRLGLDGERGPGGMPHPAAPSVPVLQSWRAGRQMQVLPVLAFSLNAHSSLFSIYAGLRVGNLGRITSVVKRTMAISAGAYLFVGLCGYSAFGSRTAGDVLRNFDGRGRDGDFERLIKFAYAIFAVLGSPLIVIPLRAAGGSLAEGWRAARAGRRRRPNMARSDSGAKGRMRGGGADEVCWRREVSGSTALTVLAACAAGIIMPDLQHVIGLTGATASIFLGQVLPCTLYLRLCSGAEAAQPLPGLHHRARARRRWHSLTRRGVQLLLVGSLIAMGACTRTVLQSYGEEEIVVAYAKEMHRHDTSKVLADRVTKGELGTVKGGALGDGGAGEATDAGSAGKGGEDGHQNEQQQQQQQRGGEQERKQQRDQSAQMQQQLGNADRSESLAELEASLVSSRHRKRAKENELERAAEIAGVLERAQEEEQAAGIGAGGGGAKAGLDELEKVIERGEEVVEEVVEEVEDKVEEALHLSRDVGGGASARGQAAQGSGHEASDGLSSSQ